MKKLIIASVAAMALTAYAGEYVGVTVGAGHVDSPKAHTNLGTVLLGTKIGNYDLSAKAGSSRESNTTAATTRNFAEFRGAYEFSGTSGIKPWGRVGVGSEFGSGYANTYYTIEPGVGFQLLPTFRVDASLKRVDYSNRKNVGRSEGIVEGSFALSKSNTVSVKYTDVLSGPNAKSFEIGIVHAF